MDSTPEAFKEGLRTGSDASLLDPLAAVNGRYVHLDVSRVCCIMCVVLRVFDPRLMEWNALYGQSWVLQLLWIICGVCFCLSRRSLPRYLGRLLVYFGIGTAVNLAAWAIKGWSWGDNVWFMVNQMNFVLCLGVICFLLNPLKHYLHRLAKDAESSSGALRDRIMDENKPGCGSSCARHLRLVFNMVVLAGGVATISAVYYWVIAERLRGLCVRMSRRGVSLGIGGLRTEVLAASLGTELSNDLQVCTSGLWIVLAFPRLFSSYEVIAWLLLANLYAHRLVLSYGYADMFFHGFYLVMVALTACCLGLSQRGLIGKLVHRYWMVTCFTLAFLWTPGMHGHLMTQPPTDMYTRNRYILIEAVIIVAWLTAGHHMIDPMIFTHDKLLWVNEWAVVVFLVHQGALWISSPPLAGVILVLLGPAAWLTRGRL